MKCAPPGLSAQRGVAAMEFALVLVLILALLFGVIAFGSILWVQQTLSFAAGEGVRSILLRCEYAVNEGQADPCPSPAILARGCETAINAAGWFSRSAICSTQLTAVECPGGYAAGGTTQEPQRLRLDMAFDSRRWPPIHTAAQAAGMIGIDDLAPATLRARSTVVLTPHGACLPS
ncbi:MAG: TadE/TadG family type IV pilus assembly protein [Corticimicrobacter sp.]|uniref:TadE/TadG family type IV pilus assembly protein n=1 Tax=Corticimicrobacter sp. TaxID=2678536 RepID=UPI0032D9C415